MRWWDGHMTGWGWFWMTVIMIGFWTLIAWVVVMVLGETRRSRDQPPAPARSPEDVLADRFARGEIDEEQYRRSLQTLRETRDRSTP